MPLPFASVQVRNPWRGSEPAAVDHILFDRGLA
jgi:hypothetical protein